MTQDNDRRPAATNVGIPVETTRSATTSSTSSCQSVSGWPTSEVRSGDIPRLTTADGPGNESDRAEVLRRFREGVATTPVSCDGSARAHGRRHELESTTLDYGERHLEQPANQKETTKKEGERPT